MLLDPYRNNKTPLRFQCVCGTEHQVRYMLARKSKIGPRCPVCVRTYLVDSVKVGGKTCHSIDSVRALVEAHGATLLTTNFVNLRQTVHFTCSCGQPGSLHAGRLITNKAPAQCRACRAQRHLQVTPRGENHPNWKPELTEEDRAEFEHSAERQRWERAVIRAADYTCDITGERRCTLSAHHLYGFAANPAKRFELSNGVCIRRDLHELFHSKEFYGKGGHTPEQYIAFKAHVQVHP